MGSIHSVTLCGLQLIGFIHWTDNHFRSVHFLVIRRSFFSYQSNYLSRRCETARRKRRTNIVGGLKSCAFRWVRQYVHDTQFFKWRRSFRLRKGNDRNCNQDSNNTLKCLSHCKNVPPTLSRHNPFRQWIPTQNTSITVKEGTELVGNASRISWSIDFRVSTGLVTKIEGQEFPSTRTQHIRPDSTFWMFIFSGRLIFKQAALA